MNNSDISSASERDTVWRGLDQTSLDHAYDQQKHAPNMSTVIRRFTSLSEATRLEVGRPERFSYGGRPAEGFDLYRSSAVDAPVHVFVHGGGWRSGNASDFAFPAEMFLASGAHYVALDFSSLDDTAGDLSAIAHQVRTALAWIYRNAERLGADRGRIYISGHSSGAHLAALSLTTDWEHDFGIPADCLKGGILCSGMFDLEPVRLSARGKGIALTDELTRALSPQNRVKRLEAPVAIAYGTLESPEFQRQSREFFEAAERVGKAELFIGAGYNHFEIAETLGNPYGMLGRLALAQMNLAPRS